LLLLPTGRYLMLPLPLPRLCVPLPNEHTPVCNNNQANKSRFLLHGNISPHLLIELLLLFSLSKQTTPKMLGQPSKLHDVYALYFDILKIIIALVGITWKAFALISVLMWTVLAFNRR
jgi:hypothetical protein